MEIEGPFTINDCTYSKDGLITHAKELLHSVKIKKWEAELYRFILDFLDPSVPLVQKTSGTTGDPKNIILNRGSMVRSAQMTIKHFNLLPGGSVLLCLPVSYIAGKMMVVRALTGGLHLRTTEPSGNPIKTLDTPVHFAAMVPLQLHESITDPGSVAKIEAIGKLLIGGGEINPWLREKVGELSGVEVFESFAMSETYTHFAVRRINGDIPGQHFKCMEGVRIDTDKRGCLVVDVPGVTNASVVSNDLVEIKGTGEFEWLGRADNVISTGGIKIVPEILEKRIGELTGREVLVIGVADKKLGKKLVLVVEEEADAEEIFSKDTYSAVLQDYEIPKEIITVPSFPRNRSMKIDRNAVFRIIITGKRIKIT